ncbi:MAG: phosphatase [Chitinophagaceae bacterium]|nr:phosphatase [Chitinophagaceae bacterium]
MSNIIQAYQQQGGVFITPPSVLIEKLSRVKAILFDWDGVFNDGRKTPSSGSGFSEVDAMGINMLRFSLWLSQTNKQRIKSAIITGETNPSAFAFARREAFDTVYYQMKDKTKALEHFCTTHQLKAEEIAFFFDDILDLSLAQKVGMRFLIQRKNGLAFNQYIAEQQLADYATSGDGGQYGIREVSELWMTLNNTLPEVISKRMQFKGDYSDFITQRNNSMTTNFFQLKGEEVLPVSVD